MPKILKIMLWDLGRAFFASIAFALVIGSFVSALITLNSAFGYGYEKFSTVPFGVYITLLVWGCIIWGLIISALILWWFVSAIERADRSKE